MFWRSVITVTCAAGLFLAVEAPRASAQCEIYNWTSDDLRTYFGTSVAASADWFVVGASYDDEAGVDTGAAFVFRHVDGGPPSDRSNDTWVLHQKLTAHDASPLDGMAESVAIDGGFIVVSNNGDDDGAHNAGSAYVYRRNDRGTPEELSDDVWEFMQKLVALDPNPYDDFAKRVAIDGAHILVGAIWTDDAGTASGSAYVFRLDNNGTLEAPDDDQWIRMQKLTASDAAEQDNFGADVAVHGEYLAVGATGDDDLGERSGAVYVFRLDDNGTPGEPNDDQWVEMPKLVGSGGAEEDRFGSSISISGDHLVVGAPYADAPETDSGAAYVFRLEDNETPEVPGDDHWIEVQKCVASDGVAYDEFGFSACINGSCILVGSRRDDDDAMNSGSTYVFWRGESGTPGYPDDDVWLEEAKLTASDADIDKEFGFAVDISGPWAFVGAPYYEGASGYGSVYVFVIDGPDCNSNGIADECDILDGTSPDDNENGIPDECEGGLDVKPGSCPNPLNRSSHGVLPVALVGKEYFDVTEIDISSVLLSRADGTGGAVAPNEGPPGPHSVFEDVATPFEGELCDCHELQGDGIEDLSMKFRTDDVVEVLELDALNSGDEVELVVTGTLLDGTEFTSAADCILIVPPGTANLAVTSNVADVFVDVAPADLSVDAGGFPGFDRSYDPGTVIALTAAASADGRSFRAWEIDGVLHTAGQTAVEVTIVEGMTARAVYRPQAMKNPGLGDYGGWPVPLER